MAIYPKAKQELIPPGQNDPRIIAVGGTEHVAVSLSSDIYDVFDTPAGIESHFYIDFKGNVIQYRDTAFEADAQADGNSWIDPKLGRVGLISVETEGMGEGKWTDLQIQALKDLWTWCEKTHPHFRMVPATAWNSGGIGYHSQFKQWNPDNHSCPGPKRIIQHNTIIVPWINNFGKPVKPPTRGKSIDKALAYLSKAKAGTGSVRETKIQSAIRILKSINTK